MVFSPITLPDFKHFQMKDFPKSVMIFLLSNSQWITLHILVQYPLQHKPTSFIHNTCKQLPWPLANCWMQNHNFLLNLTPTSFICPSLTFVLTVPGNSQSLSLSMIHDFVPFYNIPPPQLAVMGALAQSPTTFHWAGAILYILLWTFCSFILLLEIKEWARKPCQ